VTVALFIQGGGDNAHTADADMVRRLQAVLGDAPKIAFPKIDGLDTLDWTRTEQELTGALKTVSRGGVVVAHSLGASAMLKLLSSGTSASFGHLFLLAAPYNGADGEWGDSDFSFPADFARNLPKDLPITLWHARDDTIIPVANAELYRKAMPKANIVLLDKGGHQFESSLRLVAEAIHGTFE